MITAELGNKHTCPNNECGARFYDLNIDDTTQLTCPKCQNPFKPEIILISRKDISEENKKNQENKNKNAADANAIDNEDDLLEEKENFEEIDDIDLEEDIVENGEDEDKFLEQEEEDASNDVSMIIGKKIGDAKSEE